MTIPKTVRRWLLADIGGTHTRLAPWEPNRGLGPATLYDNGDYRDPLHLLNGYLAKVDLGGAPEGAAFAVAGPVIDGRVQLTNHSWLFDAETLKRTLNLHEVRLLNDFAAIAHALPSLDSNEAHPIGGGAAEPHSPLVTLGPGTGLGVAALVPCGDHWTCVEGEGGHVTMAATDDEEERVLKLLRKDFAHVSAERVLSGQGLSNLYRVVSGGKHVAPEVVTRLARTGDAHAANALDLFFAFLGTAAKNLALNFGARGGVYLAGGILPRLEDLLSASAFRERFEAGGRMESYLQGIPTSLISVQQPGLRGLAAYVAGERRDHQGTSRQSAPHRPMDR